MSELLARHRAVIPNWVGIYYDEPIEIVSGKGCRVTDAQGRGYLDFFAGILTNMLGYDVAEVRDAVERQIASGVVHTSTLYLIRGQVELAEVGRERLVMFDRTSSYFELTQSLFLRGGVVAHTVMELDNIEAAKKMVEEGLGVALLPRVSVAREVGTGLLAEIEVVDAPPIRRSVDAIRRKDAGSPGGVVHAFLQELEATLRLRERRSVQLVV